MHHVQLTVQKTPQPQFEIQAGIAPQPHGRPKEGIIGKDYRLFALRRRMRAFSFAWSRGVQ